MMTGSGGTGDQREKICAEEDRPVDSPDQGIRRSLSRPP